MPTSASLLFLRLGGFIIDATLLGCSSLFLSLSSGQSYLFCWLYFSLCESSSLRATIGKKYFNLVVCKQNDKQIHFIEASIRFFGKNATIFTMGLGLFLLFFNTKKQSLHDIISGCYVKKNATSPYLEK